MVRKAWLCAFIFVHQILCLVIHIFIMIFSRGMRHPPSHSIQSIKTTPRRYSPPGCCYGNSSVLFECLMVDFVWFRVGYRALFFFKLLQHGLKCICCSYWCGQIRYFARSPRLPAFFAWAKAAFPVQSISLQFFPENELVSLGTRTK